MARKVYHYKCNVPLSKPLSEIDAILEKLEDDEDVQKVFTNLV
jgi:transcriptional/translational regulatory protein YebC/TACO1